MLKGWLPPFCVGEPRAWPWIDNIGGASFLEWSGLVGWLAAILWAVVTLVF